MSKAITKAQCLIVLIGRSAMPNLIAVITRLQKNGYVFFIHTEETRKIAENLQELLKKKKDLNITSELIKIKSYADPKMVSEELQNKFLYIKNKLPSGNTYIELNYTGGTKVISAIGFITFKEVFAHYNERLLLSYLDGEQSKIFINSGNKEHIIDYSSAEVLFSLEIKDVADVHKEMISEEYRDKPQKGEDATKYSRDIMVYIISHIEEREKLVIDLEELRDGVNHFKKNNPDYIQKIFNSLSKGNFIRALYERYEIFYEALTTTVKGNSFKNKKDTILERLTGIWLEESLYGVIEELKDEGIIDSYAVNFYRYRGDESNREAEIDFILLKDLKLYFLSVSSVDGIKKAKFKLYEVKQRARMVAENEAAIGTLTFIKDKEELIEDYKDIWEDDPINTLLLAWKDIPFIKEKITQWIQGKGEPINV